VSLTQYVIRQAPETFAAGTVIFEQGDAGKVMYVVGEGQVDLRYGDGVAHVGPGESFGEMAIIDQRERSATAIAATDTKLYPITQGLFLVLVHETPFFALEVMRSLSDRLRAANQRASG
jgi:CRP-like cAMP-binding protein